MATRDDIIDYSAESVREALVLLCDGSTDPDPERRADLIRALRSLPPEQTIALVARERGYSLEAISRALTKRTDAKWTSRLLVRALANLRNAINGRRLDVTSSIDRRVVQR